MISTMSAGKTAAPASIRVPNVSMTAQSISAGQINDSVAARRNKVMLGARPVKNTSGAMALGFADRSQSTFQMKMPTMSNSL